MKRSSNRTKTIDLHKAALGHRGEQKRSWRRIVRNVGLPILAVVVLLFILVAPNYASLQRAYRAGTEGKVHFLAAQEELGVQNFRKARTEIIQAKDAFQVAGASLDRLILIQYLPGLRSQFTALKHLTGVAINTADGLMIVLEQVDRILTPIIGEKQLSIATLSRKDKRAILQGFAEAGPAIRDAQQRVTVARAELDLIPKRGLLGPVASAVAPVRETMPKVEKALQEALPMTDILPVIAGYPEPQTYLFLLQNNTELRPAGGFIGTYSIVRVVDGEIDSFATDNVYNLDSKVESTLFLEPPLPLKKYNNATQWFFRDSNWSPDFPTSAREALRFYRLESGSKTPLHGVIAITPTFIEALLGLTGDMTIQGITFTKDNFTEKLQDQVSRGFLRQGVPQSERKEIIGDLGTVLLNRLFALPQSAWPELLGVINENLREKHLLFYSSDEEIQKGVVTQRWGGALEPYLGDYVFVADANVASLKSDPGVKRAITHRVEKVDGRYRATTEIEYRNEGTITWKTTRYRTYVRLYVPQGSMLLTTTGAEKRDRDSTPGDVEVTEELGKTVFGAFKSIEPTETETITFVYDLPESVARQLAANAYTLLMQKQAGTANYAISLAVDIGEPVERWSPLDSGERSANTTVKFSDTLDRDREFTITFR